MLTGRAHPRILDKSRVLVHRFSIFSLRYYSRLPCYRFAMKPPSCTTHHLVVEILIPLSSTLSSPTKSGISRKLALVCSELFSTAVDNLPRIQLCGLPKSFES